MSGTRALAVIVGLGVAVGSAAGAATPTGDARTRAPVCDDAAGYAAMWDAFPSKRTYFKKYVSPEFGNVVNPIMVTCADVTRDGVPEMIARVSTGGSAGIFAWEVFQSKGDRWTLIGGRFDQASGALKILSGGVIENIAGGVYRAGDPHCCPSGGVYHVRYRWGGTRFVLVKRWVTAR